LAKGGAYMVIFLLLALIFSFVVGASAPTAAFVASPLAVVPAGVVAAAATGLGRMPAPGGRRSRTTRSNLLEREFS